MTMKNYTFSGNHPSMELVAELLNDLKKAETTLAAALARAEAAEGELESALAVVGLYQNRMFEAETRVTELEAELAALKAAGELRFLEPRFQWSGEVEIDPYEDE